MPLNHPMGHVYYHKVWGMKVRISNNVPTELVSEATNNRLTWEVVKPWWIQMIQERRPFGEDEMDYFELLS